MISIICGSLWWMFLNFITIIGVVNLPWPQNSPYPMVVVLMFNTIYTTVITIHIIKVEKWSKNKV